MPVTDKSWDGSPARFTDEQYRRSCLIDRGGDQPVKQRCSLPVREPDGTVNRNAVHAAAAALAGGRGGVANVSAEQKASAARKLVAIYRRDLDEDPPESLLALAGMSRTSDPGLERRTVRADLIEIRQKDDGGGLSFRGHASVFDAVSEDLGGFRETFKPGAFKQVLGEDVRLLFNHNEDLVLARTAAGTLTLSEDDHGLAVDADMAPTSYGRDLQVLIDRGDVNQMSFAFSVRGTGVEKWENDKQGPLRVIHRVAELSDVSVATYPAYPQTSAETRALANLLSQPRPNVGTTNVGRYRRRLALLERL